MHHILRWLLALIAVSAIGVIIFLSYKYNAPQAIVNLLPGNGSNLSLDVPDWNVTMPIADDLKNILVSKPGSTSGYEEAVLVDRDLDGAWTCPVDTNGNKGTLGLITSSNVSGSTVDLTASGLTARKTVVIGTKRYVYWAATTQVCTTDPAYPNLISSFTDAFAKLRSK